MLFTSFVINDLITNSHDILEKSVGKEFDNYFETKTSDLLEEIQQTTIIVLYFINEKIFFRNLLQIIS